MTVVLFNKGNKLMHGKVVLDRNSKAEIPDEIAKLWVKMGMNVEVLVEKPNATVIKTPKEKVEDSPTKKKAGRKQKNK